jgi:hypothetical protein
MQRVETDENTPVKPHRKAPEEEEGKRKGQWCCLRVPQCNECQPTAKLPPLCNPSAKLDLTPSLSHSEFAAGVCSHGGGGGVWSPLHACRSSRRRLPSLLHVTTCKHVGDGSASSLSTAHCAASSGGRCSRNGCCCGQSPAPSPDACSSLPCVHRTHPPPNDHLC